MQTIRHKKVNTDSLWNEFTLHADNIVIDGGPRLKTSMVYKRGDDILVDPAADIRDIAVDECDVIYLADGQNRRIFKYSPGEDGMSEVCCKPGTLAVELSNPSGIAVDSDTLYISDSGNEFNKPQIIALSRSNLQIRWILSAGPEGDLLTSPDDITTGFDDLIYVLEKDKKRVLKISRSGEIVGLAGSGLSNPTDIAVNGEGDIYILDGRIMRIFRNSGGVEQIDAGIPLKGLLVNRDNQIFAGEPGADDQQRTIFRIMADGGRLPVWSYRGTARRLAEDSAGNIYVISDKGDSAAFLVYTEVNSLNDQGSYAGTFISKPVDSHDVKNRWHRFLLEGSFPKGTQVGFAYYIADNPCSDEEISAMDDANWHAALQGTSSIQGEARRDALLLNGIEGRYLWFRITLSGDELRSPAVRELTLFFPRISYLDHLPAVYQENEASKDFLERFLAIFESVLLDVEFAIEHISRSFDALGAPKEFLSWLGSWLSISVDDNWPEDKKRFLISNAVSLYKKRGTREGLQETLGLLTPDKTYIVESFQAKARSSEVMRSGDAGCDAVDALFFPSDKAFVSIKVNGSVRKVPLIEVLYGKERFCFCVFLSGASPDEQMLEAIKRMIDEQKPAHTCYGLKALEPWLYLDMHTYLGVNTYLTKPAFILGQRSVIGRDTILHDTEGSGQIGMHARLGIDTKVT